MISRHICNEAGTHYAQDLATHLLILKNRTEPKYHLYFWKLHVFKVSIGSVCQLVCGLFWEDDRTCVKLKRLISNEFQHCLQTKLRMQHEGGVINEATYKKATSYEL
eukprot:375737_1